MANETFYYKTGLTGGAATDLDGIDGAGLSDADAAVVYDTSKAYFYLLDDDSGAAESSPDVISPDTNAGTKRWILQVTDPGMPRGHIDGGVLSNDADTAHDINITTCEARDSTDAVDITLSSEITKQIDAAWAVGDDAGGMDTGSVANSTLYAVWLIKRSDTGVVDALFSTSFSSPTMPTNYDYKRLIGWVLTDGSSNILGFRQHGDGRIVEFWFTARQQIATGLNQTSPTAQAVNAIFPTASGIVTHCRYGAIAAAATVHYALGYDSVNSMTMAGGHNADNAVGQTFGVGVYSTPVWIPPNGNNVYYNVAGDSITLYGLGCRIQR